MPLTWSRIARRIRVPLGFAFAVLYLWLARPTPLFMALSLLLVIPGILLRAYASGYVKKNAELTLTGPYAHTRNPLYLGSMLIAFGFAIASRSVWIALALVVLFAMIYVPVIRSEETFLRSKFPEFDAYAARVPRLLPRLSLALAERSGSGSFSPALYKKHREYNALIGAVAIYAALALRIYFSS
ncbi:MAG: isoprenylcysteine carboxylmethyltransferase family protein [Silvibacterium sp.]|nr:isoprenylcysteine carboxylmethyltransferase family protein [Silvibacterium sp.]